MRHGGGRIKNRCSMASLWNLSFGYLIFNVAVFWLTSQEVPSYPGGHWHSSTARALTPLPEPSAATFMLTPSNLIQTHTQRERESTVHHCTILLLEEESADLHLHSQRLALPRVTSLCNIFYFVYLLIFFCLNLSTFYNSSQVVKTRKNN